MKNYFEEIKKKLIDNINLEDVKIIDNTKFHKSHKSFDPEKYHLELKIKSSYLNSLSRLSAQKMVMKVLKSDLDTKIHALEIKIEQ